MAAINRPTEATYTIHEQVTVDTSDHEDHTFCGIMFPVKCKELLPLDHVVITSVAVRGRLGPLTVWVSNEDDPAHANQSFRLLPRHWTKIYEHTHPASPRQYCKLDFSQNPIRLRPGQTRAVYVHSTLEGDEAIVYDNRHSRRTYDDALISLLPGRAHVSETPFGNTPIWGWGNAWRDEREFVGRVEYGAVYRLWNPRENGNFGDRFQTLAKTLFMCQRRWESNMSRLPDDCIFYILNMCRWDWAGDTQETMKSLRRRRQARALAAQAAEARANAEAAAALAAHAAAQDIAMANEEEEEVEEQNQPGSCCQRTSQQQEESEESEYEEESQEAGDSESEDNEMYEDEEGNVYRVVEADEDVDLEEVDAEDVDEEESDDDEDWVEDEEDHFDFGGRRGNVFSYRDDSSDDEQQDDTYERGRRAWIRRQFARIHVLQVLNAHANDMDEASA